MTLEDFIAQARAPLAAAGLCVIRSKPKLSEEAEALFPMPDLVIVSPHYYSNGILFSVSGKLTPENIPNVVAETVKKAQEAGLI